MVYQNVKTGAVIYSPCHLSGEDWKEVKPQREKKTTKETSTKESK